MKQPKKPTLQQKKLISKAGLDWKEWNVVGLVQDESGSWLKLANKRTGEQKTIKG